MDPQQPPPYGQPQAPHGQQYVSPAQQWGPPSEPPPRRSSGGKTALIVTLSVLAGLTALGVIAGAIGGGDRPTTATGSLAAAEKSEPSADASPSPRETGLTAPERETLFLATVRTRRSLDHTGPIKLVGLGHSACTALDRGDTITAIGAAITDNSNLAIEDAGHVVGAAITAFCPQNRNKLPG